MRTFKEFILEQEERKRSAEIFKPKFGDIADTVLAMRANKGGSHAASIRGTHAASSSEYQKLIDAGGGAKQAGLEGAPRSSLERGLQGLVTIPGSGPGAGARELGAGKGIARKDDQ